MTTEILLAAVSSLWLGILTSISPCPLATNIAAIAFISKGLENPKKVAATGILYTLGRAAAYTAVGFIVVFGLFSIPSLSFFLQEHMNKILGPVLILTALFLLEMIQLNASGFGMSQEAQTRFRDAGLIGGFFLGILFALAFCPVSAALFFGGLIPLSLQHNSTLLLPVLFGIGTGLPVFGFALLIGVGFNAVGRSFDKISRFEATARKITGLLFLAVGFYFTLKHTFHLF